MEFNQIKYFIATAQYENMSKAAQTLGIAQPSLSKSITSLERELGTQLFDRSGKKLILNERGKAFLEGAKASMEELENAAAAAKGRLSDFTLNIGLFCMSESLMRCVGDFSRANPELSFNISQLRGSVEHIDTNDFDLLLYPADSVFRRYRGVNAYTEKILLAAHKDDPASSRSRISLAELDDKRFIFIKYGEKEYDQAYRLCISAGYERRGYSFCSSYELQRLMISSNQGIGFIPEESAGPYITDESISLVSITDEGFARDIFIGFKREKHLSENGRKLAAHVTEYFGLDKEG